MFSNIVSQATTSAKQNGKVITSALKKPDKYPSAKTVHFGKTTHIPEPDEDGQTDIVKTVETLLLQHQCGDSTESENDTSSTASTETSPSVSQMVRKFESICTTAVGGAGGGCNGSGGESASPSPTATAALLNGSYIADAELKTAATLRADSARTVAATSRANSANLETDRARTVAVTAAAATAASEPPTITSLGDLDPRNNFEEFRFEDSDLDCCCKEEYHRPEAEGIECVAAAALSVEDCGDGGGGGVGRVNYESFLEVTGLSQKSIITVHHQSPSSNRNPYGSHRHVQKPKDVKSRSRAKSASFEYKTYPSTVRYWTGPYL